MNNSKMDDKELVSALADGQLDAQDMERGFHALSANPEARYCWDTYHLIGDVLRSPDLAGATPSPEFVQRLAQRLAREPAPVPGPQPEVLMAGPAAGPAAQPQGQPIPQDSANDSRFARPLKLAAGFATVAAMGVAAWMALGAAQDSASSAAARLALESMPPRVGMVVTPTDKGPMLRDPALDEMLATHRQLGDVTALQAPAAGLHNATFEPAAR